MHWVSLVHSTNMMVSVLQTVVPACNAQDASLVHCMHVLVAVLHTVVDEPDTVQAAVSVNVH